MCLIRLYIIFALLFLIPVCKGEIPFINIPEADLHTIEDGLSQTRLNIVFNDSYGFLWLGTSDGLNRFDGYNYIIFRHQPFDEGSISDNFINCIDEDSSGNLWIGTSNGLNFYDRQKGTFRKYLYDPDNSQGLKSKNIYSLLVDEEGMVWVKTRGYLQYLNPETGEFHSYTHFKENSSSSQLVKTPKIVKDQQGFIWFGTVDGLFSFNPETEKIVHYFADPLNPASISDDNVFFIYENKKGELFIGTSNGLNKFDRIRKFFHRYYPGHHLIDAGQMNSVNSICEDNENNLWIASNTGILYFKKRTSDFIHYKSLFVNNSKFNISTQNSLIIDQSDILWVGGFQGLFRIDLKPRKFFTISSSVNSSPRISSDIITGLLKDDQEQLWVGTWNSGLNIINRVSGSVRYISTSHTNMDFVIRNNNVTKIIEDGDGVIWLGTASGIDIYNPSSDRFDRFENYFDAVNVAALKGKAIYDIIEDRRGDIWIATNNGVFRFQRKINIITQYREIFNPEKTIRFHTVHCLAADQNDNIWIGTEHGLIQYNRETDMFEYLSVEQDNKGLIKTIINSLYFDNNRYLWLGTSSGLGKMDVTNKRIRHFTEKDGLPNNHIHKILGDNQGNIWFSTNKGLSKHIPDLISFKNYGISDGLHSYEFTTGSGYFDKSSGELIFGGIAGLNYFYPSQLRYNLNKPNIVITSLEIIDSDGKQSRFISPENPYIVIKDDQAFNIEFSAMDFTCSEKNLFKYSLQEAGKKNKWIDIGNEHSVTIPSLKTGEYNFVVTGSNNDQLWSEKGQQLLIIVEAPFYRTGMAYFLYIFFILTGGYIIFQFRTRKLRTSNKILRERDTVSKEVEKQKDLLVSKNKNIEDSIKYAQRIQRAMFANQRVFKSILPESFILYKPKDIVSGDFYWISEKNDKIYIAAADCTGHGVPGAFMSLIGFELFRKIIHMQNVDEPGKILDHLNANFEEIFGHDDLAMRDRMDLVMRDGMDLAFCVLDKANMVINYAGAQNPLYIIRDGKLIEIKGDRFSVGADMDITYNNFEEKKFTTHKLKIQKKDMIYLFSDGYADQFGGLEGKKYKYRRFRHLLLNIHELPVENQRQYLEDSIEEWRGNIEQLDDILVIGIRADFN